MRRLWALALALSLPGCAHIELVRVRSIGPEEAAALTLRPETVVIDVGPWADYSLGHIPGAMHFPADFWSGLGRLPSDRDTPLLVYDWGGDRSLSTAIMLRGEGYDYVYNLKGGLSAWVASGRPTVPSPRPEPGS